MRYIEIEPLVKVIVISVIDAGVAGGDEFPLETSGKF